MHKDILKRLGRGVLSVYILATKFSFHVCNKRKNNSVAEYYRIYLGKLDLYKDKKEIRREGKCRKRILPTDMIWGV